MKRRFLLVCAALLALPPVPAHAIRYELIDAAAGDQNGHALAGFIEFDTACGFDCTAANIIDFSFSVTGSNEYSYSYEGPEDVFFSQPGSSQFLNAGPQYLNLDFAEVGLLALRNGDDYGPFIVWEANFAIIHPEFTDYYSSDDPNQLAWYAIPSKAEPINIGVVVPEPSAFSSGVVAAGLILALRTPWQTKFTHPNLKD